MTLLDLKSNTSRQITSWKHLNQKGNNFPTLITSCEIFYTYHFMVVLESSFCD